MLRPMVLSIMDKSGDQQIIDEAKKRFQQHLNGDLMDSNIREAVYDIVAFYGDKNVHEQLRNLYKTAEMTEEKVRLLRAIGQSSNSNIIEKIFEFIFEGDNVRMQDAYIGITSCSTSRTGRDLVWKFLQNNWTKLVKRFGETNMMLLRFVEFGLSNFVDEKISEEIKVFFDKVNTPTVTRAVKQVMERIHVRSQVLKRDSKAIEQYLKQQQFKRHF